jgi:hypothetical protein
MKANTSEQKIMIKTTFSTWHTISKNEAMEYAKWKIKAITTGKDNNERLEMVNQHFRGIQFILSDLK